MKNRIYADYNATTPVAPKHYDLVCETLKKVDGNPSSIHSYGREAKVAIEDARESIAKFFDCDDQELIFTSGATEANNLVLQGVVGKLQAGSAGSISSKGSSTSKKPHIIISGTEHASVKSCAELLRDRGHCDLTIVSVKLSGIIDSDQLLDAITEETCLVAIIFANNEVGSVNPIFELATEVKKKNPKIHFHTDAVQAFAKLDLTGLDKSNVDSLSVSSHKIGGFKGTGVLYLKRGSQLNALISGGGQERARRPGTENIPGIVSFGIRANEILENLGWLDHCTEIKFRLEEELKKDPRVVIHGDMETGLSTTVNFHADGISGEEILLNLDLAGIAVSTGSACSSGVARPSSVLLALGYNDWQALNSIRISFGYASTLADVDKIISVISQIFSRNS